VRRVLEKVPVEAAVVAPLAPLADLAAHEEER
jgi:hypothetical protein